MEQHVKILAVLFIALGALGLALAGGLLAVLGGAAGIVRLVADHEPEARIAAPILLVLALVSSCFVAALAIPGIVAGLGLMRFRPWARLLGVILCAVSLLNLPIGTIFGVYGLWVLLNEATPPLFEERTRAG